MGHQSGNEAPDDYLALFGRHQIPERGVVLLPRAEAEIPVPTCPGGPNQVAPRDTVQPINDGRHVLPQVLQEEAQDLQGLRGPHEGHAHR